MSGLCHVNLQNARVDLQSGHADFLEWSSVFCIMVMKILQNSHVNNWSGRISGLCHVNFAECSCGFAKWSCEFYRMLICILHNGDVDLHNGHEDFAEQSCK